MQAFIKGLSFTLIFCAYSFMLFIGGMFIEKRIAEAKEVQETIIEEQIKEEEKAQEKTPAEYHRYYEIVVSRIKTSELEAINKDAMKEYILGYAKRYKAMTELFFKDTETKEAIAEETVRVPKSFIKTFDEIEVNTYKALILSTSEGISEEDIEDIFQDVQ